MAPPVELRHLVRGELGRVGEIDRSERIDVLVEQHGTDLVERPGDWSSLPWDAEGEGEHSVAAQVRALERDLEAGATVVGAFAAGRLVGIGAVVPHRRAAIAQLSYLHVSARHRGTGIGVRLTDELIRIARAAGATEMVVSATPSANTVRFYVARGFEPTADPLPELLAAEPDDVHLRMAL